jgi:hypothetical protein
MIYRGLGFLAISCPPPPPLPFVSSTGDTQKTEKERQVADKRGGEKGWEMNLIIRPQESLVLDRSFNTLMASKHVHILQRVERLLQRGREGGLPLSPSQQMGEGRGRTKNKTTARKLWASSYIFHSRVKPLSAIPWCEGNTEEENNGYVVFTMKYPRISWVI